MNWFQIISDWFLAFGEIKLNDNDPSKGATDRTRIMRR